MKKTKTKKRSSNPPQRSLTPPQTVEADGDDYYDLRLYVAGQTPKSLAAFTNLKQLCERYLAGKYRVEVIDLMKKPQRAKDDQIIAIPTLVRRLPAPIRKIIGDLGDRERTLIGLELWERRSADE